MACKINGQFLKHLNKNPSLIESGSRVKHPSLLQFYEWSRLMVLKCQKINVNKINSVFIWHSRLLSWIATHLTVSGKWLSLKAITTSLIEYGGVKQLWVRRDQIRTNAGEPTWSQTHDLMWLCWAWTDKKKNHYLQKICISTPLTSLNKTAKTTGFLKSPIFHWMDKRCSKNNECTNCMNADAVHQQLYIIFTFLWNKYLIVL